MSREAFSHAELSSIKLAVDRLADALGAEDESEKLVVARAVFQIAAQSDVYDTAKLVEIAREQIPRMGLRFS